MTSPLSRRRLLTGALGLAAAGGLDACTRYHPPAPKPGSSAATAAAAAPAPKSTAVPLPTIPASYNVIATRPQPVPGKILLGSFLQLDGMTTAQALNYRHQQLGRYPAVQQWFYNLGNNFNSKYNATAGATQCYAWYGPKYAQILDGSWDDRFAQHAKTLAHYGHPIFLRWSWEMNGDWYPHGGYNNNKSPANFVKAWRRLYDIFQHNGATNVGFMWSPYFKSSPNQTWNAIDKYYPGDDYVDWVGVSAYFRRSEDTPEELFDGIYRTYAARKPIIIAETGIAKTDPAAMVGRLQTFSDYLQKRPGIASVLWFDSNIHVDSAGANVDLRIDANPQMEAAFKQMISLPIFDTSV